MSLETGAEFRGEGDRLLQLSSRGLRSNLRGGLFDLGLYGPPPLDRSLAGLGGRLSGDRGRSNLFRSGDNLLSLFGDRLEGSGLKSRNLFES